MNNKLKELEREKEIINRKIVQTYIKIGKLNDINMNTFCNIPTDCDFKSLEVQNRLVAIRQRRKCLRKLHRRNSGYIKQERKIKSEIENLKKILNNELEINDIF